jgi:hypothetical protein
LTSPRQKAEDGQGGGGTHPRHENVSKSFVFRILTAKSYALKILQTIFAPPAPVKDSRGVGEGGTLKTHHFSAKCKRSSAAKLIPPSVYFAGNSTGLLKSDFGWRSASSAAIKVFF